MQTYYSDCRQQLQLTEEYNTEHMLAMNDNLASSMEMLLIIQERQHAIESGLTDEPDTSIHIPSNATVSKCLNNYRLENPHRLCTSWLWGKNMVLQTNSSGTISSIPGTCLVFIFGAAMMPSVHVDHVNSNFMMRGNMEITYRLRMENEKDLVGLVEDGDMAVVYSVDGYYGGTRVYLRLFLDVIKQKKFK